MATETLYATALTAGTVSTSNNALGAPNGTFTTDVDNVSWTARFAMGNPVGNTANGTHTITLRVRKETGNGTPSVTSIRLFAGTTDLGLITSGSTNVTSTTGADVAAPFADTILDGYDLSTIEVEIVTAGVGGSGSNRTCVQLDGITWSGDFTTASTPNTGSASGGATWAGTTSGARASSGSASGTVSRVGAASGVAVHAGTATGSTARSGSATGVAPASVKQGSATAAASWTASATGTRPAVGSASGTIARMGSAAGARASTGDVSGGIATVAAATGVRRPVGAAIGNLAYAGSTTGTRTSAGSIAGVAAWSGAATGAAPTIMGSSSGNAAGTVTRTGSVTGTAPTNSATRWRLIRPGSWDYASLGFIADDGAVLVGARPDAYWVPAEDQGASENVNRYSYRIDLAR